MSTQHGGAEASGASPAEPTAATEPVEPAVGAETAEGAVETEPGSGAEPPSASDAYDAQIAAAGGSVLGESPIAAMADRTRVRRAPRYKRFAVLGGLLGALIAAIATPLASYDSSPAEVAPVSPTGLFVLLLTVAMFSDRAARVPPRTKRTKKARR